jgi:hypothetical protein
VAVTADTGFDGSRSRPALRCHDGINDAANQLCSVGMLGAFGFHFSWLEKACVPRADSSPFFRTNQGQSEFRIARKIEMKREYG